MEAHDALQRHDQVIEADDHGEPTGLARQAALLVAVIAAFLALASFLATEAFKEVVTGETHAGDLSAQLEANDTKTTIADANVILLRVVGQRGASAAQAEAVTKAVALEQRIDRDLAPTMHALEEEIDHSKTERDHAEGRHRIYELSSVSLQIGIVLAGVAILTRRRWLLDGGGLAGALGVALLGVGAFS
jgi:Domain of unknown function (DUF4337)